MDDKKKEVKEGLLEKLIEHLMEMPESGEGSADEEASESPSEEKLEMDGKPKLEMKVMEVKAKPKFKMADGSEMEDESFEDLMKRKKAEGKA